MKSIWAKYYRGFSPTDGTINFYLRILQYISPHHKVLDLGAGRAAWFEDDENLDRKNLRLLKGKVDKVVAADVDPVVLQNKAADNCVLLEEHKPLPFEDETFDLVIADYVLEHINDESTFSSEISRILKVGGLFAARTPHKYCYVAVFARLMKNSIHAKIINLVQPERKEIDIFPTAYKLNQIKDIKNIFSNFIDNSFIFRTDPAYYFGKKYIFYFLDFLHRMMPSFFSGNIFVFLTKK